MTRRRQLIVYTLGILGVVGLTLVCGCSRDAPAAPEAAAKPSDSVPSVEVTDNQLKRVKVEKVVARAFAEQREALGYIDFNQDHSTAISTPYPGRILTVPAKQGDDVAQGAVLFTLESPDLIQAESTLISTAGVLALTTSVLDRARTLFRDQGIPQKELDQAVADQQSADGAYRAARDAVRVFGKTNAQMDEIVASRKTDLSMPVLAPMAGRVTQRNAAVGTLVQPGMTPAPFVVSDIHTMWLIAAVTEADLPAVRLGQRVVVKVAAYPGRQFDATISNIGESVDPTTRRILVRSEVKDPKHELRPQMFASFVIQTGDPVMTPAVPANGVVREGDGTMVVWVTTDHKRFVQRQVKIGLIQEGFSQILSGLSPGDEVASEGALFLSNALATANQ